jgi:hypothetical protein
VVVNLLSVEEFDSTEPLQDFQADRMEKNLTCVLVVREAVLIYSTKKLRRCPRTKKVWISSRWKTCNERC